MDVKNRKDGSELWEIKRGKKKIGRTDQLKGENNKIFLFGIS